jgi:hypothetical protein
LFNCCDILKSECPETAVIAAGDFNPVSNGLSSRVQSINQSINQNNLFKHGKIFSYIVK